MWILPADLEGLHVELTEGPHLLPWHYSEDEIDRLAWLLRGALKGVEGELRLEDRTLRTLSDRRVTAPTSLVVAIVRETSPDLEEVTECVRLLGARCALLQFPEPQEMGYGWLERQVKAPLYKAIGAWVKRPGHPLAAFNVQALPVLEAAALTTDPVELVELLERTLAHRLHHADVGCEAEDYHRSLLLGAGKRLAERLKRLESTSLAAALELLLGEGKSLEDRDRNRMGMTAIEKVGLGRRSAGELSLGPLARSATSTLALGALESELPKDALSESARVKLGAHLASRVTLGLAGSLGVKREGSSSLFNVPPPVDGLEKPIAAAFSSHQDADSALRLLREIGAVPSYRSELPAALRDRLVGALRWLDTLQQGANRSEQQAGRLLEGLLRLWSARGAEALREGDLSLGILRDALVDEPEPWLERAVAAAGLRHAGLLVRHGRTREDLDHAEELARRHLDVARRLDGKDAAPDAAAYLCLAEVALHRRDDERAHDCADKAVRSAHQTGDHGAMAASLLTLARATINQNRDVEAEQYAREALKLVEANGDAQGMGACLRELTVLALWRNPSDTDLAWTLGGQAFETADAVDDVAGRIDSLGLLAQVAGVQGRSDRSRELALQAASLADIAALPALRAVAYLTVAESFSVRGDRDQAADWAQRALVIFEALGNPRDASLARRFLAPATNP
jgi:tetratricopeptide (TPR) repeat protein